MNTFALNDQREQKQIQNCFYWNFFIAIFCIPYLKTHDEYYTDEKSVSRPLNPLFTPFADFVFIVSFRRQYDIRSMKRDYANSCLRKELKLLFMV